MFEPLAIGNWILKAEVSDESRTSTTNGMTGVNTVRETSPPNVSAPSAMTAQMYQRALGGRSRSKTSVVYRLTTFKHLFYTDV